MRPTRRAVGLVVLVAIALWLGASFGARSLNALVVPALVALVAAAVQLFLADRPTVTRRPPTAGFPGDSRRVELAIETDDPLSARIVEDIGEGLASSFDSARLSVPTTVEYDIGLRARGEHRLGPLVLTATDALGLFSRTFEYPRRTPVLVYPELHDIGGMGITRGFAERAYERGWRSYVETMRPDCRGFELRESGRTALPWCAAKGKHQSAAECAGSCPQFEPEPPRWRSRGWPIEGGPGKAIQRLLADRRARQRPTEE